MPKEGFPNFDIRLLKMLNFNNLLQQFNTFAFASAKLLF